MNIERIIELDLRHVWHPYAGTKNPPTPYVVDSAEGVYLNLADGRRVIDGMSSWWAVAYGYKNPKIDAAVKAQLEKTSHVMFGGICVGKAFGKADARKRSVRIYRRKHILPPPVS